MRPRTMESTAGRVLYFARSFALLLAVDDSPAASPPVTLAPAFVVAGSAAAAATAWTVFLIIAGPFTPG